MTSADLAIKLLQLFLPWYVSINLPKGILKLIYGDALVPPDGWPYQTLFSDDWTIGDPLPPGLVFDLSKLFPDDWQPGDPLPSSVFIDPSKPLPPGWKPGDPFDDSIIVDLVTLFPPGWKPGDPLPEGLVFDLLALFPPGWKPGAPLPANWPAGLRPPIDPFGTPDYLRPGPPYLPPTFSRHKGVLYDWFSHTGSAFWESLDTALFDGEHCLWETVDAYVTLHARDAFTADWRPTYFKLTHDSAVLDLAVVDTEMNPIAAAFKYVSGTSLPLTFLGNDIDQVIVSADPTVSLSEIQFYGQYQPPTAGDGAEC
jgi:hypothetical protein